MNTFLKILAAIFLLMWIFIGAAMIIGGITAFAVARHYAPAVSGLIGGPAGMMGGGSMMQKFADPRSRASFYKTILPEQKACLIAAVGAVEVQRALTEKNYQPSADVVLKAGGCLQ